MVEKLYGLHLIDCCEIDDTCLHARRLGTYASYSEARLAGREWAHQLNRRAWLQISEEDSTGVVTGQVDDVLYA